LRPYFENTQHKKRLAEWLKREALNSNPSTAKNKKYKMKYKWEGKKKREAFPSSETSA
jgi:hypothetical protein